MNVFLHIDLNVFMAIICLIMYWSNRNMGERQLAYNYIFRLLILSALALLILEAVTWLLDGNPTPPNGILYHGVTILLYILTPVPAALWALYVNGRIFQSAQRLRSCAVAFGIPVLFCAALTLLSPLTGWMYTIDAQNVYQRGIVYPLLAAVSFLPIFYASAMVLIHKKRITARLAYLMVLFMLPPVIGTIIQVLFYGVTVLWSSMTISIFLIYTNVQSSQIHLDHLTGAINRRQLDIILSDRIKAAQGKQPQPLACILLDIDRFKAINDTIGHLAGDEALKDASALLRAVIRKRDILARFGGDEFIIITDIDNEATLFELCQRIRQAVEVFNGECPRAYTLGFSIGCAVYDPASGWNKDRFIAHIDTLMYRDKNGDEK